MVSTFTPDIQLEEPARGDYVGTWDTPVNANWTLLDLVIAGRTTISLNNSNVVLSAAQYECATIIFNSTLTGSVAITFPTSFTKPYNIYHTCTGSSAFTITLNTTAAGGQVICAPPGEVVQIYNDGTNLRYMNMGRVGTYWDYAGSSVPSWVSGCTVPPYLNCDGTTFSAATFPQLAVILGSTTLPDSPGRARYTLNQGTGRLTTAGAGIDGNTARAAGGNNGITLGASQIPTITSSGILTLYPNGSSSSLNLPYLTSPVSWTLAGKSVGSDTLGPTAGAFGFGNVQTFSGGGSMTYTNSSQAIVQATAPGYVGGLTLIRTG